MDRAQTADNCGPSQEFGSFHDWITSLVVLNQANLL